MPRLYGKFAFECKIWKSSWKMFMVLVRRGLYFLIEHSDSLVLFSRIVMSKMKLLCVSPLRRPLHLVLSEK